jgi:hypothetical protein
LRTTALAEALFVDAPDPGWDAVKRLFRGGAASKEFARSVAARMAGRGLARFDEAQLGEMFTWLTRMFPYSDRVHYGTRQTTRDDEVGYWRSAVLKELTGRGTQAAAEAMDEIRRTWPALGWLARLVRETRRELWQRTWVPAGPDEILALVPDVDRRLVASGAQLLDLLVDSLARLQVELQGEWPASANLWDELSDGGARPKGEEHLSDEIARHLRRDLVGRGLAIGREVQLRRPGWGAHTGRRTDLYVEAATAGDAVDPIVAIIEVKGSWNRHLLGAMRTQLAAEYVEPNPRCDHALYVVGWYLCARWADEERKTRTRRHGSREALEAALQTQAESLAGERLHIKALVLDCGWH